MKGSATVEMLYIMPVIFLVFLVTVYSTFYYHDKAIIAGAIQETTAVGSALTRQARGMDSSDIHTLFAERIRGKLILFSNPKLNATIGDQEVHVEAFVGKRSMKLRVAGRCVVTKPEEFIRNTRRINLEK